MKTFLISAAVAAATLAASAASAGQAWVGQNHLNYRTGPGQNYPVAGTFSPCTALNTYDTQYGWVQIQYQGQYYWVHGDYILNYACTYTPPKNTYTAPKNTYTPPKKKGYSGGYSGGGNY
ncbi:SH3 domain-containing protein [uncultured Mameliella sp.]|uniref:SH3 domain-containing protein n=1 Tax=uncultured Mameliella sp. TaxID=1447087 RepID=UPI002613B936|nr:SH3 domain-containing protein [uncultured Mameliella sp.]